MPWYKTTYSGELRAVWIGDSNNIDLFDNPPPETDGDGVNLHDMPYFDGEIISLTREGPGGLTSVLCCADADPFDENMDEEEEDDHEEEEEDEEEVATDMPVTFTQPTPMTPAVGADIGTITGDYSSLLGKAVVAVKAAEQDGVRLLTYADGSKAAEIECADGAWRTAAWMASLGIWTVDYGKYGSDVLPKTFPEPYKPGRPPAKPKRPKPSSAGRWPASATAGKPQPSGAVLNDGTVQLDGWAWSKHAHRSFFADGLIPVVSGPRHSRAAGGTPIPALLTKNRFARTAGLELEYCGLRKHDTEAIVALRQAFDDWRCKIDKEQSVPGGFEVITSAYAGDYLFNACADLSGALKRAHALVNDRCGYHVHVDSSDLSWHQLRDLVLLYCCAEPALIDMVPPGRKANRFAYPCGHSLARGLWRGKRSKEMKPDFFSNIYAEPAADLMAPQTTHQAKYSSGEHALPRGRAPKKNESAAAVRLGNTGKPHVRFRALNVHSHFYRGTIECRLAAGTLDFQSMYHWSLLWVAFLEVAAGNAKADGGGADGRGLSAAKLVEALGHDSQELLLKIAAVAGPDTRDWCLGQLKLYRCSVVALDNVH